MLGATLCTLRLGLLTYNTYILYSWAMDAIDALGRATALDPLPAPDLLDTLGPCPGLLVVAELRARRVDSVLPPCVRVSVSSVFMFGWC